MTRTAHIAEDYSARTLAGAAVVSRLILSGWGALSAGDSALTRAFDETAKELVRLVFKEAALR